MMYDEDKIHEEWTEVICSQVGEIVKNVTATPMEYSVGMAGLTYRNCIKHLIMDGVVKKISDEDLLCYLLMFTQDISKTWSVGATVRDTGESILTEHLLNVARYKFGELFHAWVREDNGRTATEYWHNPTLINFK